MHYDLSIKLKISRFLFVSFSYIKQKDDIIQGRFPRDVYPHH